MRKTVVHHTCDRCGHEFDSPKSVQANLTVSGKRSPKAYELCSNCTAAFDRFMDQIIGLRGLPHGVKCHLQQYDPVESQGEHTIHHTGQAQGEGNHSHDIRSA